MNNLILLGASGSIGKQTIEVILNEKKWTLEGFSVGKNVDYALYLLEMFTTIKYVYVREYEAYKRIKDKYKDLEVYYGDDGLNKLIEASNADIYVNALSGFVGVIPSINIIKKNKILCLANKETVVCLGELYTKLLEENKKARVIPIDSEHTGLLKCILKKDNNKNIEHYYITGSGGPFYNLSEDELKKVTLKDALTHPTWNMGNKITIESASMINKTFEIITACYLFNIDIQNLSVLVDKTSYVHALLKLEDETYCLNYGPEVPTMKEPIKFALNHAIDNSNICIKDVGFAKNLDEYSMFLLDYDRFPITKYAEYILKNKKNSGLIFNAVCETCVDAFLDNKIKFVDIYQIVNQIMKTTKLKEMKSIDKIIETNNLIKAETLKLIKSNY